MSHPEQINFVQQVKNKHTDYFKNKSILEIGSLNINGTVRDIFEDCFYIGLDIASGKNVDVVSLGHEFNASDNSFDVVISTECFEHDPHWRETFLNMVRLCRSNGLVIFTCATTGREEHGTVNSLPDSSPLTVQLGWNYYKNLTEQDFRQFDLRSKFNYCEFSVNSEHHDLYFYGLKR